MKKQLKENNMKTLVGFILLLASTSLHCADDLRVSFIQCCQYVSGRIHYSSPNRDHLLVFSKDEAHYCAHKENPKDSAYFTHNPPCSTCINLLERRGGRQTIAETIKKRIKEHDVVQ